jgi:glycosyltransferase involved in cell wall biosynthesis
MSRRVFYDGLHLAMERGTGIATYAHMLTHVARRLGHEISLVYATRQYPPKDPLMREIAFFDAQAAVKESRIGWHLAGGRDQLMSFFPVRPTEMNFPGVVIDRHFGDRRPAHDHLYGSRLLFGNAFDFFARTGRFTELAFDRKPDIFHFSYQLPLKARGACNIYTIHDLVPLRLPFTALDVKRNTLRMLKKIAAEADHIVTVSEHSRRDIIQLLDVDERRVTNTYQAVRFPEASLDQTDDEVAGQIVGTFGLEFRNYLLFYGAIEPKKNVLRLIEAYLAAAVDVPLVLVAAGGWENERENKLLAMLREKEGLADRERRPAPRRRRVHRFEYVSRSMLVTLIRGARAVLFPSLYEGFGLPVLEAMQLGTPVVTSTESSLPEVAGDAALLVDPYETTEIARAIRAISSDADLRAGLSARGRTRAELFSVERYTERMKALYDSL